MDAPWCIMPSDLLEASFRRCAHSFSTQVSQPSLFEETIREFLAIDWLIAWMKSTTLCYRKFQMLYTVWLCWMHLGTPSLKKRRRVCTCPWREAFLWWQCRSLSVSKWIWTQPDSNSFLFTRRKYPPLCMRCQYSRSMPPCLSQQMRIRAKVKRARRRSLPYLSLWRNLAIHPSFCGEYMRCYCIDTKR